MNKISNVTAVPEKIPYAQQAKAKDKTSGADFQNMLSGALKTGKTTEAAKHTSQTKPKAEKTKEAVKQQDESGNENDVTLQALANPQTQPQQIDAQDDAPVEESNTDPVHMAVQAIITGQAQQQIEIPRYETQMAQQIEITHPEAQQTPAATQAQATQQPQIQPLSETLGQTGANPTEPATEQISADIVESGVTVTTQQTQSTPLTAELPKNRVVNQEAAQERFDDVITKASQELAQSQPVPEEQPVQTVEVQTEQPDEAQVAVPELTDEEPVQMEDAPTEDVTADTPTDVPEDTPIDTETDGVAVKTEEAPEQKSAPRATVIESRAAPITDQRPLKEVPETDKAAMNMAAAYTEPKPEVVLREPEVQPANTSVPQARVPDQAEQIRVQVIENLETEKMEFQMQLRPQELGRVDVKMIIEGGKLAVQIMAANEQSAAVLSKQAESLLASLRTGTLAVESVTVVTAGENVSGQMDSQYNLDSFQNQANAQRGHDGQNTGSRAGNNSGTGGNASQNEDGEAPSQKAPQRILNYKV